MTTAKIEYDKNPLAVALAAFQAELPTVTLDGDNPHFKSKFTTLSNLTSTAIPVLSKHGLAFSSTPRVTEQGFVLEAHLIHESGERLTASFPIAETNPQKVGSAVTYFRRYALAALTGIVAETDDDGNTASIPSPAQAAVTRAKNATAKPPATDPQSIIRAAITAGTVTKEAVNGAMDELKEKGLTGAKLYEAIIEKVGIGT